MAPGPAPFKEPTNSTNAPKPVSAAAVFKRAIASDLDRSLQRQSDTDRAITASLHQHRSAVDRPSTRLNHKRSAEHVLEREFKGAANKYKSTLYADAEERIDAIYEAHVAVLENGSPEEYKMARERASVKQECEHPSVIYHKVRERSKAMARPFRDEKIAVTDRDKSGKSRRIIVTLGERMEDHRRLVEECEGKLQELERRKREAEEKILVKIKEIMKSRTEPEVEKVIEGLKKRIDGLGDDMLMFCEDAESEEKKSMRRVFQSLQNAFDDEVSGEAVEK